MRRAHGAATALLVAALAGCGGDGPNGPTNGLGPQPVPVAPAAGTQVTTDTPTFTARNASGYDAGQAQYTFEVTTAGLGRAIASTTVPAGRGTTSVTLTTPLPRGMNLSWRVVARKSGGETASVASQFRLPNVACQAAGSTNGYARRVVSTDIPFCPLSPSQYRDTEEALGPPDAVEIRPGVYLGFVSLADGGSVAVDMESCATDGPGMDVRVFQAVGAEPINLYAGGTATGPWIPVGENRVCDTRFPGGGGVIRYCDFDLAAAEVQQARFFKIQDAERTPCSAAGTDSEGADLDAVQILNLVTAGR
jgi:hypothetical protein